MNYCQQAAETYEKMLITEYNIVVKGIHGFQLLTLYFTKDEFKHTLGIHKSITTDDHNKKFSHLASYAIFEKALTGDFTLESIATQDQNGNYIGNQSNLVKRIYEFPYLEDYFDKADALYIWDKNKAGSLVDADYLIQIPSKIYSGEYTHLFLGLTSSTTPLVAQIIQDGNRVDLSKLKYYAKNGLCLNTEYTSCKNYIPKLASIKILYKEKVVYRYVNGKRVEQSFSKQVCDENFEAQMQKSGYFFSMQNSNIVQVKFNSPNTERIVSNNGAAVLTSPLSPRPPFGQAVREFLKDIVNKVKEIVKRLFRKSDQDTTGTGGTNRGSGNTPSASAQNQEETAGLKSESHELRDNDAPIMEQSQNPLVKTAAAPRKSFSQGLDELAKRPRAQGSPKPPVQNIANKKHHKD